MPDILQFRIDFYKSWYSYPCSDNGTRGGFRMGQHLYNCALKVDRGICPKIYTEDPYYKDENIDRFFAYLEERWNIGSS
jgi:hypothetical protein